jgi:hypothetical protein
MSEKQWLVGIDPSLKNAGAAIYCPSTGERALFSGAWYAVIDWLSAQKILGSAIAIIEDPNMDKTLFGGWPPVRAEISKFTEKKSSYGEIQSIFARAAKQAQNVGENKASAKVFIDLFRKHGIPYGSIAPSTRDRADRDLVKTRNLGIEMLVLPTKTTAHQFQQLTGFDGRSNEHSRDAAMLIFKKTIAWGKMQVQIRQQYEQNR